MILLPATLLADAAAAGLFAGMGALMIVLIVVGVAASIFWIWMLIDCLTSAMAPTEKLIWVLVIFFLHLIGAILYYVIARNGPRPAMT